MISSLEAIHCIMKSIPVMETEWCPYHEAGGRVLRRSIIADRDLPPFDRVMMDGIAISLPERNSLQNRYCIEGTAHAGDRQQELKNPKNAWEVMTGAVLPRGCDTVIPLEDIRIEDGAAVITASDSSIEKGQYVHCRGSDFGKGSVLVEARCRITPRELAVAVSCGKDELEVSRLPHVALLSSGNELVEPHVTPEPYQIRQSNIPALDCLIRRKLLGATVLDHLADDPAAIKDKLRRLLAAVDVVVISGGASKGKKDFFPSIMESLGVNCKFHGVAQKPGKPFWFGVHDRGTPVFVLPGNPLSTLVGGYRYLVPALEKMLALRPPSIPPHVALADDFSFKPNLTFFLPVMLCKGEDGMVSARPRPANNSGDYVSVVPTSGFLELPAERTQFQRGERFPFFPW